MKVTSGAARRPGSLRAAGLAWRHGAVGAPEPAPDRHPAMSELRFMVPGIACRHCADAISARISGLLGVEDILVDPDTRWVVVWGQGLDVAAIRTAVDETGHVAEL